GRRSALSRIGPYVLPQPTISTSPSWWPCTAGRGNSAAASMSFGRRLAVIWLCILGLPLGCPHSSCSSPEITGYLPPAILAPGGACRVVRSRGYGRYSSRRGEQSSYG